MILRGYKLKCDECLVRSETTYDSLKIAKEESRKKGWKTIRGHLCPVCNTKKINEKWREKWKRK